MKKPPHYPMRPEEVLSEEEIREIEENNGSLYPPVTAASLDKACGTPGCTEDQSVLYLHARCHPESGTRARYIKKDRVLIIDCLECGRRVSYIAVAPQPMPLDVYPLRSEEESVKQATWKPIPPEELAELEPGEIVVVREELWKLKNGWQAYYQERRGPSGYLAIPVECDTPSCAKGGKPSVHREDLEVPSGRTAQEQCSYEHYIIKNEKNLKSAQPTADKLGENELSEKHKRVKPCSTAHWRTFWISCARNF